MQTLTLNAAVWSDMRFDTLRNTMKWNKAETLGTLALLWEATRQGFSSPALSREQLADALSFATRPKRVFDALLQSGFLEEQDGQFVVVDNEAHYARTAKLQAWGRMGGKLAHKKPRLTRQKKDLPKPRTASLTVAKTGSAIITKAASGDVATKETWSAYAEAYQQRYGVPPLRNAKVNGQIAHFVKQVGQSAAPDVVRFYLSHNAEAYMRCQHDVGCMLRDASGLHTQMLRNDEVTEQTLRVHSQRRQLEAELRSLSGAF